MENTSELRGLTMYVYRDNLGDCSNGGISSRCDRVTVVGVVTDMQGGRSELRPFPDSAMAPFAATEDAPAVVVVKRKLFGGRRTVLSVEPLEQVDPKHGTPWMAGGCYVATSDSRLRELLGADEFYGALSFHDRTESWELYAAMTRD